MKRIIIAILMSMYLLIGCANQETVDINKNFDEADVKVAQASSDAIQTQAIAIEELASFECLEGMSAMECTLGKILSSALAAREIASMKIEQRKAARPKTSMDVQESLVRTIGNGIPVVTLGVVSYKAVKESKGENTVNANHSTVDLTQRENRSTAISSEDRAEAVNTPADNTSSSSSSSTTNNEAPSS